jgi:hypothetical protein
MGRFGIRSGSEVEVVNVCVGVGDNLGADV